MPSFDRLVETQRLGVVLVSPRREAQGVQERREALTRGQFVTLLSLNQNQGLFAQNSLEMLTISKLINKELISIFCHFTRPNIA